MTVQANHGIYGGNRMFPSYFGHEFSQLSADTDRGNEEKELSAMAVNHCDANSCGADVVLTLPSPHAVQSRRRRSRIAMLCFSCLLITGLVVLL